MNKKPLIIIIVILLVALLIYWVSASRTVAPVASFEECVEAGNPVMESYPRQCRTATGELFVEEVEGNPNMNQETVALSGVVTKVDNSGVMVDGPFLITIRTSTTTATTSTTTTSTATSTASANTETVVAVPSMGIMLCAAYENIRNVADITVGQDVEVRGFLNEEGQIIPCEASDHYLRVSN